jgi:hypothetical protein
MRPSALLLELLMRPRFHQLDERALNGKVLATKAPELALWDSPHNRPKDHTRDHSAGSSFTSGGAVSAASATSSVGTTASEGCDCVDSSRPTPPPASALNDSAGSETAICAVDDVQAMVPACFHRLAATLAATDLPIPLDTFPSRELELLSTSVTSLSSDGACASCSPCPPH